MVLSTALTVEAGGSSQLPDGDVPYLKAMVEYSRIGDKVWATSYNSARATGATRDDEVSYILYRIDQWFEDLPEHLKLCPQQQTTSPALATRGLRRLQLLLHSRANQMKILLLQPFLRSASNLHANRSKVQSLVNLAKDTIRRLDALNQSTDIYQNQQMCFNHFLVSALGVIFLVVALAPAEHAAAVRDEFHMALDLIRGLGARSYVSSRLWRRISDLRPACLEEAGTERSPFQREQGSQRAILRTRNPLDICQRRRYPVKEWATEYRRCLSGLRSRRMALESRRTLH
ncbi:hypothetical protein LX32DRAFT_643885 [Colletotrichum zoysiae]|uniref:Uncharacterized protein n=1 Tax=Colletotrichum zoysiae TaxID=1216348 RepID=A0AAD9LVW1_9PEZI|nr:hypothetical protein LX32DRAFT_643885 [Colletotrichum zoysiae]